MNHKNFGIVEGRLTRDVVLLTNRDGSRKALFTIATQCNYKGSDGKHPVDFINFEGFIPAGNSNGVYDYLKKGTMVGIEFTIKSSRYEKDGQTVDKQCLFVQSVDLKESRNMEALQQEPEELTIELLPQDIHDMPFEDVPFN